MASRFATFRLACRNFFVDARTFESGGRWVAVAETPDGPSVGVAATELRALREALAPFDGVIDELLKA